jgi:hypothetical protein
MRAIKNPVSVVLVTRLDNTGLKLLVEFELGRYEDFLGGRTGHHSCSFGIRNNTAPSVES